jgi:hypothetical protein
MAYKLIWKGVKRLKRGFSKPLFATGEILPKA